MKIRWYSSSAVQLWWLLWYRHSANKGANYKTVHVSEEVLSWFDEQKKVKMLKKKQDKYEEENAEVEITGRPEEERRTGMMMPVILFGVGQSPTWIVINREAKLPLPPPPPLSSFPLSPSPLPRPIFYLILENVLPYCDTFLPSFLFSSLFGNFFPNIFFTSSFPTFSFLSSFSTSFSLSFYFFLILWISTVRNIPGFDFQWNLFIRKANWTVGAGIRWHFLPQEGILDCYSGNLASFVNIFLLYSFYRGLFSYFPWWLCIKNMEMIFTSVKTDIGFEYVGYKNSYIPTYWGLFLYVNM